ncbi:MAG TPA: hypothetical protein VHK67_07340 [Rhabdochlamydiaceae bacterium]|nr:hypothetical protein [Rhabdochlamydiaceae bacterium]
MTKPQPPMETELVGKDKPLRLCEFGLAATLPNRPPSDAVPVRRLTCFATRRSTGPLRVFSSPTGNGRPHSDSYASIWLRLAESKIHTT